MKIHQAVLYPFSILYDGATRIRNRLFDLGLRRSFGFGPAVIAVGNLAVGGTGKTPMIEYLIRLLNENFRVAVLSRGYGRKTKGFRIADSGDNATSIGDEPFQLYSAWNEKVIVAVGEKRAVAIPKILSSHQGVQAILLDDAFQHRAVRPDLNIMLTTWQKPFFDDYVVPAGRLRESRQGAARADLVVVTKCPPDISLSQKAQFEMGIRLYTRQKTPVFFCTLAYGDPKIINGPEGTLPPKMILVSGLADAGLFEEEAKKIFEIKKHFRFPDHQNYNIKVIKDVRDFAEKEGNCGILTTEKDVVKWDTPPFRELLKDVCVATLPVYHSFLGEKEDFDDLVIESVCQRNERL